jgi:hypothetical protein
MSKEKKPDIFALMFCIGALGFAGVGASIGWFASLVPVWFVSVLGGAWALMSVFFGMVLYAIYSKREMDSAILEVQNNALKTFDEQEKLHRQMRKDAVWIATHRVAVSMVGTMMHGLKNDEQRSAALAHARQIIEKELRLIQIENAMQKVLRDEEIEEKENKKEVAGAVA